MARMPLIHHARATILFFNADEPQTAQKLHMIVPAYFDIQRR